jgi:hypothetical protein
MGRIGFSKNWDRNAHDLLFAPWREALIFDLSQVYDQSQMTRGHRRSRQDSHTPRFDPPLYGAGRSQMDQVILSRDDCAVVGDQRGAQGEQL